MFNDEYENGVFSRVQARGDCPAGKQRSAINTGSNGAGDLAVGAAELANGGSRRERAIESGDAVGFVADTVASGLGVTNHAFEARAPSHADGAWLAKLRRIG